MVETQSLQSIEAGLEKRAKRNYGKIDDKVLVKAIVSGKTLREAGELAGSKASEKNIKADICHKIQRSPTIKKSIIEQLEEKRQQILDNITEEDIKKAPFNFKVVSLGIITDKIQLLRGDPTQIMRELKPMVIREVEEAPDKDKEDVKDNYNQNGAKTGTQEPKTND